jgi:hypothetical protein
LLHARRNDMRRPATPRLLCLFYMQHRTGKTYMHLLYVSTLWVNKVFSWRCFSLCLE